MNIILNLQFKNKNESPQKLKVFGALETWENLFSAGYFV